MTSTPIIACAPPYTALLLYRKFAAVTVVFTWSWSKRWHCSHTVTPVDRTRWRNGEVIDLSLGYHRATRVACSHPEPFRLSRSAPFLETPPDIDGNCETGASLAGGTIRNFSKFSCKPRTIPLPVPHGRTVLAFITMQSLRHIHDPYLQIWSISNSRVSYSRPGSSL